MRQWRRVSEQRTGRWQRIDGVSGNLLLWDGWSVDGLPDTVLTALRGAASLDCLQS